METKQITEPSQQFNDRVLALLSSSVSLTVFVLTMAAMRATARSRDTTTSLVILGHAGAVFLISITSLLHVVVTPDTRDEKLRPLSQRFLRKVIHLLTVPAIAYVGGVLSPYPIIGWMAGTLSSFEWGYLFREPPETEKPTNVLRGTIVLAADTAKRRARKITRRRELMINWVCMLIPERFAEQHFLIVGATGSGKTVVLRLLMQSVLPQITPGSNRRALVYDAKQDMMEILSGLPLSCEVILLNPLDARSAAWDMAKDITTPATATQIASIFIEEEKGRNPLCQNT